MTSLFDPIKIGDIELANRIVMALPDAQPFAGRRAEHSSTSPITNSAPPLAC